MITAQKWDLQLVKPSALEMREWQKYRGWKLKILEELEHSGGLTTREISSRIGYRAHSTSNRLVELHRIGCVERVQGWGWRISGDGIFLLNLNYTTTTPQQHHNNATTTPQQEKLVTAPLCFHAPTCHIKKVCQDKTYNFKTAKVCADCIWDGREIKAKVSRPQEMKVGVQA